VELIGRVRAEPELPPLRVGAGHGPVLSAYADYFGRTVNIASRLCAVAGPAEVLLHVDAPGVDPGTWHHDGLRVEPRTVAGLKGIDVELPVFAISAA
jgi:class 3 adenylate cyclase